MSDTFMASAEMIPDLPVDPNPVIPGQGPQQLHQGMQRPMGGVPKFFLDPRPITNPDGSVTVHHIEMVSVITPGDPKSTPCHKVTDAIRQQYAAEYESWRQGVEQIPSGWPLDLWRVLTIDQVHHLKSLNIFNVEQIAEMADSNLHRIPMGRTLKNQAIAALKEKERQDGVETMRVKDEMNQQAISQLEDRNSELESQLLNLTAKIDEMLALQTTPEPEPAPTTAPRVQAKGKSKAA